MRLAGLVLAAGAGTRLAPLTDRRPKPLLPVLDRSLLQHQIERVLAAGAERVFVNTHYRAAAVARHLKQVAPVASHRVEPRLTGPAGALSLFADALTAYDAVLVASGDVLVGDDLDALVNAHARLEAALTFGVVDTAGAGRFGVLDVDAGGIVRGAVEKPDVPEEEVHPVSAGIYCVGAEAITEVERLLDHTDTVDFARDLAPALLAAGSRVAGHRFDGYWRDVGTPSSYAVANRDALAGRIPSLRPGPSTRRDRRWRGPTYVHPSAVVEADVVLEGPVVVGDGARLGRGARVVDAVVLPEAVVPPESVVLGGIVATGGP